MSNYDFNAKKYVILMIFVLVAFLIFTVKAFDYLPENSSNNINKEMKVDNINKPSEDTTAKQEEQTSSDNDDENHKSGHFDFMPKSAYSTEQKNTIEDYPAPEGVAEEKISYIGDDSSNETETLSDEKALNSIIKGKKYVKENDFSNALKELQKVDELTQDSELRAMAYEAIAEIYAHNRRYGTAISFATKALNLSPDNSREIMIARIYYLSGKTEDAISLLNKLIKKGF